MSFASINGQSVPILSTGADWSEKQLAGTTLRAETHATPFGRVSIDFTLRYADFEGQQHAPLTKEEHASQRAVGIRSWMIFQKTTRDPDGGRARGEAFGREALAYAEKIDYKGELIAFTADAPAGSYDIPTAMEFFRGAQSVVNAAGFLCCVYGFWDVIYAAMDRGVGDVYWLCGDIRRWRPGIHLYQFNNGRIYPDFGQVEADLCIQFEKIGSPLKKEEAMDSLLVRTHDDPTVFRVTWGADGCWKSQVGDEYNLLIASGVPVWTHNQVDVDLIPTRSEAARAVWNYYVPTGRQNERGEDEYLQAFEVLRDINLAVADAVADVDEEALAAALKAQGVQLGGATPAQVKAAVAEVLRSVPAQDDAQA